MYLRAFIFLLASTCWHVSYAQDFKEDYYNFLKKLMYSSSIDCELRAFAVTLDGTTPAYQQTIRFKQQAGMLYYETESFIMISNATDIMHLDKNAKRIVVSPVSNKELVETQKKMMKNVPPKDSLVSMNARFIEHRDGLKTYEVEAKEGLVKKSIFKFDSASGLLKSLRYVMSTEYNSGVLWSETEFLRLTVNQKIDNRFFDLSNYFKVEKGVVKLMPLYKNYQLTDTRLLMKR